MTALAGICRRFCGVCEITEEEILPATGHKWSAWKTVKKATAQSPGKQSRTCSVCGEEEPRQLEKEKKAVLTLSADSLTMRVKQKTNAFYVVKMAQGDSVKSVKSSKPSVVTVSKYTKKGAVTLKAKKKGAAKITVTLKSGLKKTVPVKVQTGAVKTKKITASPGKITLKKGKTKDLTTLLTVEPITSQDKVTYKTSDKKVAAVSAKGVVTGKKAGKVKITVTSGKKKVTITVTVKK